MVTAVLVLTQSVCVCVCVLVPDFPVDRRLHVILLYMSGSPPQPPFSSLPICFQRSVALHLNLECVYLFII